MWVIGYLRMKRVALGFAFLLACVSLPAAEPVAPSAVRRDVLADVLPDPAVRVVDDLIGFYVHRSLAFCSFATL